MFDQDLTSTEADIARHRAKRFCFLMRKLHKKLSSAASRLIYKKLPHLEAAHAHSTSNRRHPREISDCNFLEFTRVREELNELNLSERGAEDVSIVLKTRRFAANVATCLEQLQLETEALIEEIFTIEDGGQRCTGRFVAFMHRCGAWNLPGYDDTVKAVKRWAGWARIGACEVVKESVMQADKLCREIYENLGEPYTPIEEQEEEARLWSIHFFGERYGDREDEEYRNRCKKSN